MKNTLLVLLLAFVAISCQTNKEIVSTEQSQDFTNYLPESKSLTYHNKSGILYQVTHDDENMFVLLKIMNPNTQRKITAFGMEMYIDITGKNKKEPCIVFPLSRKQRFGNEKGRSARQNGENLDKSSMLGMLTEFELKGFTSETKRYFLDQQNPEHIQAFLQYDASDFLIYKAIIPFSALYGSTVPPKNERTISIGLQTGYLDMSQMQQGRPMGGGGGGGGQGRRGGGMQNSEMQEMLYADKLWLSVKFN